MIVPVNAQNRQDFDKAAAFERVFGSKNRTALAAYGIDSDDVSFWVGYAPDGAPAASLYLAGGVLVISTDNRLEMGELAALVREQGIAEVDTCFAQAQALQQMLGGRIESSYYMAYDGGKIAGDFAGITPQADLREVFSVLQQSHEYYRAHLQYDRWAADLSRKLELGLMELVQLNEGGVPIGTGSIVSEDDQAGAIAAVAVIPAFRGRGLGTKISQYLVNRILDKGKTPVLISGYDAVAALYRQVGFHEIGRWGELYLNES